MDALTFDPGLLIWSLITFGVLFLLLARFAFRPLRKILQEREDAIRGAVAKAEQARREAEEMLDRNRARLDEAREESRRIIGEGHRVVADLKREAEEKAQRQADQVIRQARAEIDRETQRGLDELKTTVANLSVRIARQVIRTELDETRHQELAEQFIERLKKTHARKS
jgi:F-type H+-transporting ATPase subunit b